MAYFHRLRINVNELQSSKMPPSSQHDIEDSPAVRPLSCCSCAVPNSRVLMSVLQVTPPRGNSRIWYRYWGKCRWCLRLRCCRLIPTIVFLMKLSVRVVASIDQTRPNLILGERVFDLGEDMVFGYHASVAQIVAIFARRFRPK